VQVREAIGRVVGIFLAPAAAVGSFVRGTRLFHADGVVYRAEVRPVALGGARRAMADRIAGSALVRLSNALRRRRAGKDPSDALGIALRFHPGTNAEPEAGSDAQDLLLLSFRHFWQALVALRSTDPHDFLANTYYALAPFRAPYLRSIEIRIVPEQESPAGEDHFDRLACAVAEGKAVLRLEVRLRERDAPWEPVADIALCAPADVDQEALHFNPFRDGAGIVPIGFVQGLRWAVYPAAQLGRDVRRRLSSHER
jgi:hypothetical protein